MFSRQQQSRSHLPLLFVLMALLGSILGGNPALAAFGAPNSLADLTDKLGPSVVNIYTTQTVKAPNSPYHYFFQDQQEIPELFRRFFDQPQFRERNDRNAPQPTMKRTSLGSGVITSADGFIITNYHVVEDADEINVRLSTHEEYEAKVIGRDAKTDIALIKIEPKTALPAVSFGDSEKLRVGDWVMAIGNPFGFERTVTAGIVSAKGRSLEGDKYEDFIQTDASINPGNSGGPLFDMDGKMVGLNTAIYSRTGGNIGIGFAIPINMAANVMTQLKERGKVVRGWLGVMIQQVTPELSKSFGLDRPIGALVGEISPNSPAMEAGIKQGDVILEFNGKKIEQMNMLPAMVAQTPVGTKAQLSLIRKGAKKDVSVTIGELKEEQTAGADKNDETGNELGLAVQDITPEIADSLGLSRDQKGVLVANVGPGSTAQTAGLKRGDLIVELNHEAVPNLAAYNQTLRKIKKGESLLLLVLREGHSLFVAVKK